ncbi:hypothetical protein [Hamadaea tsunoensis]|uniref:hypothetical protein n=1 Tax=Hamadaea tsunoensis TaxID=53368 RepID=UPI0012FBDBF2|nr:hypothetical protein [Hamadaea tsunoensis]
MSWSLFVVPLDTLAETGMAEWIASAGFTRGVPEKAPQALPRPSAAAALAAFQAAGCHGTNWFEIVGEPVGSRLPECRNPATCASTGGLDLGEVSLYTAGATTSRLPVAADATVQTVTFRKPNTAAVLRAVCALAAQSGPQLVFDDSADAFAVWPGEPAEELGSEWPW